MKLVFKLQKKEKNMHDVEKYKEGISLEESIQTKITNAD